MADYRLSLTERKVASKKLKELRAEGKIPSVVYGEGEPVLVCRDGESASWGGVSFTD